MRLIVFGAVAALVGCQAMAAEPDAAEAHLKSLALDCINSHAAEVERLEPSLSGATTFLVSSLCSAQVAAHDRYVTNSRLLATMRSSPSVIDPGDEAGTNSEKQLRMQMARAQAAWQSASVDPVTGELKAPPEADGGIATYILASGSLPAGRTSETFVAAAAEAVLAARTARLGRQP